MTVYRGEGEGEGDHGTIMATPFSFCTSDVELADGEFVSSRSSRARGSPSNLYSRTTTRPADDAISDTQPLMGNVFSSSSGRRLSPFSQKMAEGVFPEKVCHHPHHRHTTAAATATSAAAAPPFTTASTPASASAGRRAVGCDFDSDVL